jgi:hypothetical protein
MCFICCYSLVKLLFYLKNKNMKYLTIEDKIEHCKTSILVCQEKIEIEGHNGSEFWVKLKKQWEEELEKFETE